MSGSANAFGWLFGGTASSTIWHAGASLNGDILRSVYLSKIQTDEQDIVFTSSQADDLKYNYPLIDLWLGTLHTDYADRYLHVPVFYGQKPFRVWSAGGNFMEYVTGERYFMAYEDLRTKKLDKMEVKLSYNDIVKSFDFTYHQTPSSRLQLESLRENTLPPYRFTYNTSSLPGYLSDKHDHWGYFNNRTPLYSDYSAFHTYREPDFRYTEAGPLTKIQYPTGGVKKLIYEPHYYNRRVLRNKYSGNLSLETVPQSIGGGLRIKEIHEKDSYEDLLVKSYVYSPGILNGKPEYYWPGYRGKLINGYEYTADRFYSQSLLPVSNNPAGGSVSYTTVSEILQGNGKIEYTFTNHDTRMDENSQGSIDPQKTTYSPLTSKNLERGMITEIKYYAEGSSTPSKRETFTYAALNDFKEFIKGVYFRRLNLFGSMEVNAIEGSAYKNYVYPYNVTKKTEYYAYPGNLTQSFEYTYAYNHLNQIKTETKTDHIHTVSTAYKYPCDYGTPVYQNIWRL